MVEAALSISILLLAGTAIAAMAYDSTASSMGPMRQENAALDMLNIVQGNSTYANCIEGMGHCSRTLLKGIRSIYSLSYIGIRFAGTSVQSGDSTKCISNYDFCEPLESYGYRLMCVYTCAG